MAASTAAFDDDEALPPFPSSSTASAPPPPAHHDYPYSIRHEDANGDSANDDDDDDVSVNVGDLGDVNDLDQDMENDGDLQNGNYTSLPATDDDDFLGDDISDDPIVDAHRARLGSALAQLPAPKDDDNTITTTSSGFDYFYDSPASSPTAAASSSALIVASTSSFVGPTIGPAPKGGSNYGSNYKRGIVRNAFTGLSNQGATCYMNSLLQTMFMTPELRLGLYRWKFADDQQNDGIANDHDTADEDNIPFQLQKLFAKLQITTQESISTKALTKSFGWTGADVFQQHDVQELCRVLFDALEKSFKGTINETLVNDLYQGTMKDYVQCRTCGYESSRQDEFLDLSLVIRPFGSSQMMKSVEEAIEFFLKPEVLNGDNQWMCDRCQVKRDAIKGLKFSKLPYLLSLQLKRFDYDYMTDSRVKLHDQVTFPKYLDMNSYVHDKEGGGARGSIARKMSMERHELEGGVARRASITAPDAVARVRRMSSMDESKPAEDVYDEESLPGPTAASAASIADTWSPGFDVDALIAKTGPFVYELYSVLIHSGSALGGHYYAYIKSFESDKWYDFNDSSVSELSETEVKKAWGGSGSSNNSYGGRISYSTCAHMLMYRLVSRETNINATPKESIPEYLVERMREEEERQRRQELERIELTKKMLIKFFIKTNSKNKIEKAIHVYKTATLTETLAVAHEAFAKDLQGAMPSLANTRIRMYNDYTGLLSDTYEGREDQTLTQLHMYSSYQLYLDTKKDDEEWEPYDTSKLQLYIRRFQIPYQDAPSSWASPDVPDMTSRYVQVPDTATVGSLLDVIAKKFDIPEGKKIRLVRKMATSYTSTPVKVLNRDGSPQTLSLRLRNDHQLVNGNEVYYEECDDLTAPSIAEQHFEREANLIEVNVWYLDRLAETIRIDRRETVLALKQKMSNRLDLAMDSFKILRGNHRAGIEIKSVDMTLFNLSICQGHAVTAVEGTPLRAGEYLFRLMLSMPKAAAIGQSKDQDQTVNDEPVLTVSSKVDGDEKDLFDLDELQIRTNQEENSLEVIANIKVGEEMAVDEIRQVVWDTLKQKGKLAEDGSITRCHIRLRDVQTTTLTQILVDGCSLKDASGSPVYEGRGMVAELLSEPEQAQVGHRIVHVVYVDRSKWRFCKRRRFQLVVPKEHVGEDPSTDDDDDDNTGYGEPNSLALVSSTANRRFKSSASAASSQAFVSTWIPEQIAERLTIPPEQARFAVFAMDRDTFDICEIFKTDFDTWDRCLAKLRDRQYNYQLMAFVADADVPMGGFAARERMHVQDFLVAKKNESYKASERSYSSYSYSSNYRKPKEAALVIRTKTSKSSDKKDGSTGGSTASSTNGVSIRTPTAKRATVSSDTDEEDEYRYAGVNLYN